MKMSQGHTYMEKQTQRSQEMNQEQHGSLSTLDDSKRNFILGLTIQMNTRTRNAHSAETC